ncbi:MAG TPA: cytochrome b/b6 domain-containing protein [Thiobacillaceae bacterium]|nr:cytochrome b/b6 domain-containing protein [Thiobacillaceae bacterium]
MEHLILRRERVFDPVLRIIHAWNALLVILLLITALTAEQLEFTWQAAALRRLHLWLGYLLFLGLVARFIWGLAGPEHARWSALWHPRTWLEALRSRRFFAASRTFGHHPLASGIYLLFYTALAMAAATGLALAAIDQGRGPLFVLLGHHMYYKPWVRTPHEWLEQITLAFLFAHMAALILHEKRHRVPIAQGMVSGYQYLKEENVKDAELD